MNNVAREKATINLLFFGTILTTVFLVTESVTDPVNTPKFLIAGGLGVGLFTLFLSAFTELWKSHKTLIVLSGIFVVAMINATLWSDSPLVQNIYGNYGRNTGLLAYLFLVMVTLGALLINSESGFLRVLYALFIAGAINVIYCIWVIIFGDFLSWSNPYGNILGLFGNPNFISAFLGIFIAAVVAFIVGPSKSMAYRAIGVVFSALAFYAVVDSSAIQGLVVTAGGLGIVGFFFIRSKFRSLIPTVIYLLGSTGLGILAVMGALQKGPFSFIYKTSVSLRGEYWQAGYEMGQSQLLTGVGMDAYGDWFRRARSLEAATIMPGPNIVTNAAHNVVLDMFAYGGLPLLISYLGFIILGAIASFRVFKRSRIYNPVFTAMFTAWVCYQVQSLISINQIGLAVWGWTLTGALIAYERVSRTTTVETNTSVGGARRKVIASQGVITPQLVAGIGVLFGLLIASPPMAADIKWRTSLDSQSANQVLDALKPGYLNPLNSSKLAQAAQLFASNNLPEQTRLTALEGIEFNPDNFDAWRILFFIEGTTEEERNQALLNLKRLDPNNPDVTAR